ncbi:MULTISPECIES: P27 family phage terminase small subunit [unclassified Pseudoalteromonas]|uniref:P27 family phage terminase small subunit n=1 Tax=unclassified Pseudoalteromonas TaxID=194690 RepID=UPI0015F92B1F|nr:MULTISPECIES: P27 family phage terminase small subunit [unclassified Pseudoalteromonas]MBB1290963.1 P27 family phage terminase small subunit [Pseudoalteromonas sp. SR41-5]MBB1415335.1 P27 family phage terminase small subunit [Pseudoalteromonas sp. SG43-8]
MAQTRAPGAGKIANGLTVGDTSIKKKPNCPKALLSDQHAVDAWHSNLGIMFERKSFAAEDIPHLINYCNAISKIIKLEAQLTNIADFTDVSSSGSLKLHPHVTAHNMIVNQSVKLANQLGLSPMARARMLSGGKGDKDDEDDDFNEF